MTRHDAQCVYVGAFVMHPQPVRSECINFTADLISNVRWHIPGDAGVLYPLFHQSIELAGNAETQLVEVSYHKIIIINKY